MLLLYFIRISTMAPKHETPVLQEAWVFQGRLCEEWVGVLGGWVAVGINGA